MPQIMLDVTPELERRMGEWSQEFKSPPGTLAVNLLEEYFDDCDDADRLCAEIDTGQVNTHPWGEVRARLGLAN